MAPPLPELADSRNKFEDLSGVNSSAYANPYDALIEACEGNPVGEPLSQKPSKFLRLPFLDILHIYSYRSHAVLLCLSKLTPPGSTPSPLFHPSQDSQCSTEGQAPVSRILGPYHRPYPRKTDGPVN
jgi:hypothetical protein